MSCRPDRGHVVTVLWLVIGWAVIVLVFWTMWEILWAVAHQ